ncbi:hypothetical protein [Actinacidiphila sp. ITFR-21]|uniref:hypothetical protein n=1 Tax=Actinacidiphila sp. ITFR-21 TaxID=3075199 RepID=UPI002889FA80|nr:hypothetical protein [Streptomyces sp. ITFR-21]WNI18145.1 hypothetical protein RLT57_23095 [Streptomyces sp. ITFR-21]
MYLGKLVRRGVIGGVLGLAATVLPAAAAAPSGWHGLDARVDSGTGLAACVSRAHQMRPGGWTCVGGTLRVTVDGGGQAVDRTYTVVGDTAVVTAAPATAAARDDYDSWCENGSICARKINAYTSEVKGNAAYGDGHGVIGTFDIVYRQSFDGKRPRWRTLLDWDTGPQINPGAWTNNCRINISGKADGYCGRNPVHLNTIDRAHTRAWWPSSTRYEYNDQPLKDARKYHDDGYGEFVAFGHKPLFKAGVLHTGRWSKCNTRTGCQYYQVPWRP